MNQRVNISAFKYAVISDGHRRQVVSVLNGIYLAKDIAQGNGFYHVVQTKEIEAFKVNSFVGSTHAEKAYIGYDPVDKATKLIDKYL